MASTRSSKHEIEKALDAKSKELDRDPADGSIYFWLKEIGVHPNTHNYGIAGKWQESSKSQKPFIRDEIPEADLAELRDAQREANAIGENFYRRLYSAAVGKVRGESQMRQDTSDRREAESAAEKSFLYESWRATERDLDMSRERIEVLERALEDARLEMASLQGRISASNELIVRLTTGPVASGNVDASGKADVDDTGNTGLIGTKPVNDDGDAPVRHSSGDLITDEPAVPMTEPVQRPIAGRGWADDAVDDGADIAVVGPSGSKTVMEVGHANTSEDHPPAVETGRRHEENVELPLATGMNVDDASVDDSARP